MADAGALQGHLLTPQGWLRGELRHRGGRIVAIEGVGTTEAEVRGSSLPILLPGFIDLHVHAGGVALTPLQPDIFWRGATRNLPEL